MSQDPQRPTTPKVEHAAASDESIQDVHGALLREKAEPTESFAPLPLFLLFIFSALIFVCGIYVTKYSGGFDPLVYNESVQPGAAAAAGPVQVDPIAQGRKLYTNNCVQCHQATGTGVPGAYPPLAGSEWVEGSEELVVRILLHGLTGPVTVKGNTYTSVMPSFGPIGLGWKDSQISYVATYIRQEWGNKAPPVTEETVKRIRAATADRKTAWTSDELRVIADPFAK